VTWKKLLGGHDVQPHRTSKKELDDMRALVARDLTDAGIAGLSEDRRFATVSFAKTIAGRSRCLQTTAARHPFQTRDTHTHRRRSA
jgi:hypothetical protein